MKTETGVDRNSRIRQTDLGARLCAQVYGDVDVVEELAQELWEHRSSCRVADMREYFASERDARIGALEGALVHVDYLLGRERKGCRHDERYELELVVATGRLLDLYYMVKRGEAR